MTLRFLRVDLRCNGRHEQVQVRSMTVDLLGRVVCVRVQLRFTACQSNAQKRWRSIAYAL